MKKILLLIFSLSISVLATHAQDEPIVINSELVRIDAIVLDKDGKPVKDLKVSDFQVFQDGDEQVVTSVDYINGRERVQTRRNINEKSADGGKEQFDIPNLQPGRIITFVMDDGNCLATNSGIFNIRRSMKDFIEKNMLPNDRVAIYRTRAGASLFPTYSSDKDYLLKEVKRARWFPTGCGSAFDRVRDQSTQNGNAGEGDSAPAATFESETDIESRELGEKFARGTQVQSTLGVLNFVVDKLKTVPGRKMVFLLSEGIPYTIENDRIRDSLQETIDRANRASVAFYSFSSKGVSIPGMITSEDEINFKYVGADDPVSQTRNRRVEEEANLNSGLQFLSSSTGGKFRRNSNNYANWIEEVVESEDGYYLISYEPKEDSFKGKRFHKIDVRVKRDNLTANSSRGFYSRDQSAIIKGLDEGVPPIFRAMANSFQESGIGLQMTTLVGNPVSAKNGFVRVLLHLNGEDLALVNDSGMKSVLLDVAGVALDKNGKVAAEFNRTYPIKFPNNSRETVRRNGLDFSTDLPIKDAGIYSLRVAVQDSNSKKIGSAIRMIEIPKKKSKDFKIGNLITTEIKADGKPVYATARDVNKAFAPITSTGVSSVRIYKAGSPFAFTYSVYNAKSDSKTSSPRLASNIRVFRDGEVVLETKEAPVELSQLQKGRVFDDYGYLRLNENAPKGEYILQLNVVDKVSGKRSSELIDFTID